VLVLAELMENATVFSPPHVRVTVSAQALSYGVQLAVVDHGIGLNEERLVVENARLERRERLDLAPTEVLGLFVVGRLARRHDLGVSLSATPGGGLTATIQIPRNMLVQQYNGNVMAIPTSAPPAPFGPARSAAPALVAAAPVVQSRAVVAVRHMPPIFDEVAVDRASRSIATSPSWSAFVPQQRTEAPKDMEWPPRREPAHEEPTPAYPTLRQRVPGQHPIPVRNSGAARQQPPRVDEAAAARALVEDFEFGVRRAQAVPVTPDPSAAMTTLMPATPPPPVPEPVSPGSPVPPLTRRRPGVTLEALETTTRINRPSAPSSPADANHVRDLVEQFEDGVNRALRDARSAHQYEEESPR